MAEQPAANPNIPPAEGNCPFYSLPQELRDEIYEHVYRRTGFVSKRITKESAKPNEAAHTKIIVCKQWYREEMPFFLRTITAGFRSKYETIKYLSDGPLQKAVTSVKLYLAPISESQHHFVFVNWPYRGAWASALNSCPQLKRVEVVIHHVAVFNSLPGLLALKENRSLRGAHLGLLSESDVEFSGVQVPMERRADCEDLLNEIQEYLKPVVAQRRSACMSS